MSVKFYSIETVDRTARKVEMPKMCWYCFKRPAANGVIFCNHPSCDQPREFQSARADREERRGDYLVFGLVLLAVLVVFLFGRFNG